METKRIIYKFKKKLKFYKVISTYVVLLISRNLMIKKFQKLKRNTSNEFKT